MTKQEVAHLLSVSVRTVDRYLADGILVGVKLPGGHTVRFRREDVDDIATGRAS